MEYDIKFNRLLIFDFSHCLHRAIAQPNLWEMRDNYGRRTGGIYGSLATLSKESSIFNYFPVAVFDGHLSKRRLALYDNYKKYADKQLLVEDINTLTELEQLQIEQRNEYKVQREYVKEILNAFGIPVFHFEDWEGDDIIYILSKMTKDSIIVSDDKDMLQLICDTPERRCRVMRGMTKEFWDMNTLKEMDLDQNDFIACKAIVGDNSDNIPSACYQVGEKTASGLYHLYCKCIENGKSFPVDEKQLTEYSKLFNIPKRRAYLNFSENQFLTNVLLMDLRLVDNDVLSNVEECNKTSSSNIISTILDVIDIRNQNPSVENIYEKLNEFDIKTYNVNGMINNINRTKNFINFENGINVDTVPERTDDSPLVTKLF